MAQEGVELIVAARRDAVVPALVVGLGGAFTELLDDVAIVPLPCDARRVERALRSLRGAGVLLGARGRAAVDLGALVAVALAAGRALLELDLELVELNPVIAGPAGAVAVDAVVRLRARSEGLAKTFSGEEPLEAGGGGDAGLDRAVDEAGPAVREVRAGE